MPEETGGPGQPQDGHDALVRRIEHLEQEILRENRWWRGGLIAVLFLLVLAIFFGGHHRHHHRPGPPPMAAGPMGGPGCQGGMGYGPYRPYGPPPPWAFGPGAMGGGWGYGPGGSAGRDSIDLASASGMGTADHSPLLLRVRKCSPSNSE